MKRRWIELKLFPYHWLLIPAVVVFMFLVQAVSPPRVFSASGRSESFSLRVDGRTREVIMHLPAAYDPRSSYPLLIFLHGAGGSGRQAMEQTNLVRTADQGGFLACFPDGTGADEGKLTWNAWNCCGYANAHKVDDVKFLTALIERLQRMYSVDGNRLFLAGFSNGAMMGYRFAVEGRIPLTGLAAVAGNLVCPKPCPKPGPVAVLIIHGTADKVVLYNGKPTPARVGDEAAEDSVRYAVDFWTRHNGCSGPPEVRKEGRVDYERWAGRSPGQAVALYSLRDAGHAWPGGAKKRYQYCDLPTDDLAASEAIWRFFQGLSKS
ncbi:MAG: PHB depolymerase family esterase [Thermodesulfobacteriota bacterium]